MIPRVAIIAAVLLAIVVAQNAPAPIHFTYKPIDFRVERRLAGGAPGGFEMRQTDDFISIFVERPDRHRTSRLHAGGAEHDRRLLGIAKPL